MREIEGLSYEEMAQVMGVSKGTIMSRLFHARQKLQKALTDLDPATPEGKEILQLNRATRYIPTTADNYKGIEAAARSAGAEERASRCRGAAAASGTPSAL